MHFLQFPMQGSITTNIQLLSYIHINILKCKQFLNSLRKYHSNFLNDFFPVVFCSPLNSIANGIFTYNTPLNEEGYVVDTLANLHCDSGYRASGSPTGSRRCLRSGGWSGQMATYIEGSIQSF